MKTSANKHSKFKYSIYDTILFIYHSNHIDSPLYTSLFPFLLSLVLVNTHTLVVLQMLIFLDMSQSHRKFVVVLYKDLAMRIHTEMTA